MSIEPFRAHRVGWAAALLLALVWSATSGSPGLDDDHVLEKVRTYWSAREINDLHTAYGMEAAALPGGWLTLALMQRIGLPVRDVSVELLEQGPEEARFRVRADVEIGVLGFVPQEVTERWIRIEGDWYRDTPRP